MYGQLPYGQGYDSAYADYQELEKKKSPIGWWIAEMVSVLPPPTGSIAMIFDLRCS